MKDLVTRLKTLDYKQFALAHGEKIGMIVVALIVVTCLALTNWASEYTGEPRDMEEQAAKVDRDLKNKGWPEEYRKEFLPYLAAEGEVEKVTAQLDVALYDWGVPMSPKLYERKLPADEPKWVAVSDLRAHSGNMPMGVFPPAPVDEPADEGKPKPKPKKKDRDKESYELPGIAGSGPVMLGGNPDGGMMGMMGMMGGAMSGEKARGVRFVCVVGVVDVRQQQNLLRSALHVDTLSQAAARLEYKEFKIQRQRAVPGPNPWAGEWKDWSTDTSIEELGRASDFDPEIVAAKYTNQTFTSPLPHRLDGEWDPKIVAHPQISILTEDEQEEELIANKAAAQALADAGDAAAGAVRGGFARVQKDANQMRSQASSVAGNKMTDYMSEMMKKMGGAASKRGMEEGMRMQQTQMQMQMMMPGMMNSQYGGSGAAVDLGAERLLFRYFDFDVEPGECYRYRVKLIVENPSLEQSFVSAPTVAEGEYRETEWSAPSPPAVVQKDVEYALTKATIPTSHDTAELKVVQFDTDLGTLIMDTLKVGYGAYVGTLKGQKTLHLDLTVPALKEEDVAFSSRDVLVDSAAGTPARLATTAVADLKIEEKEKQNLAKSGKLDMAVTLNRFGELIQLDAGSRGELKSAEKRVEEEREPYKDDIVTATKKKKDDKAGKSDADIFATMMGQDTGGKKKGKRGRVDNPLKGGMAGMVPPGMMMPGMGMPPTSDPSSRRARPGARND